MARRQSKQTITRERRIHAKQRASERYGLQLTTADLAEICGKIHLGQSRCIERLSVSRSVHELEYAGAQVRVVYHNLSHEICTFLPRDNEQLS